MHYAGKYNILVIMILTIRFRMTRTANTMANTYKDVGVLNEKCFQRM